MSTTVVPLSLFRWRPKQRRMVTDKWRDCNVEQFIVKGREMEILFIKTGIGVDPGTKTAKHSAIYKPAPTMPEKVRDITLYVHV